ncbi:phage terminase large subunit family protein [Chitinolyticbacter meiyuanensis]|uniref:phage terminase large subunit family protein n=1 Tax=Chitinolyticbacter meiyuanensis TaxID=682798 RepID=UPI0011E60439|nr:phage terminase large subunit family protein [Chitinolyticbacter meiyuanensis]
MPLAQGRRVVGSAWCAGLMPDPDIDALEWADTYRFLPPTSAESGKYRSARTPFMSDVMRDLSPVNDEVDEVILVKGGQISGSETANNFLGFVMHIAPGPAMLVQPTVDAAKEYVKERINPLIEYTPVLKEKVAGQRSRQGENTARYKRFPGGFLAITGANSAQSLQSRAVRYLVLDEIDRYPLDVDKQGDPVGMATKRTDTYKRTRKVFKLSTPGLLDESRIWKDYQETDQRRIFVPCPHCGHMDYIRWQNIRWPKGKPEDVRLYCEACGAGIEERYKTWMLERYEARPTAVSKRPRSRGYHVPGLYSPLGWRSWADIARDWEQAQAELAVGEDKLLKKVVTLDLGEPYERQGEQAVMSELIARAEAYDHRMVPHGGLILTAAVDVQGNRLEIQIVAWGRGEEAWVVDYHVLWGDPLQQAVWQELDQYLQNPLRHQRGTEMRIAACAIDAGDGNRSNEVYNFCRPRAHRGLMAIKGANTINAPELSQPKPVELDQAGQKIKLGVNRWQVGVHRIKNTLHSRLQLTAPGRNYIHFPKWLPEDYFKQLTSEKLVDHRIGGRVQKRWEPRPGVRNEALDTLVYNYAAALRLGINRWGEPKWLEVEQRLLQASLFMAPATSDKPPPTPAAPALPPPPAALADQPADVPLGVPVVRALPAARSRAVRRASRSLYLRQ